MAKLVVALNLVSMFFMAFGFSIHHTVDDRSSRGIDKPLSDEPHFQNEEHNPDYDHEAFLGENEAKTFDHLTPDESKYRLGKIVDKIDKDGDGFVTQDELTVWIRFTQDKYIAEDVDKQWAVHNPERKETIGWEDYRVITYGFLDDQQDNEITDEEGFTYKELMKRDQRRWAVADQNKDGLLNRMEFTAFVHPEESAHMMEIVVLETLEDIDKDKDGRLSLEEYIGDMHKHSNTGDVEPDWVKSERDQFATYRDKDGNGYMDLEEVRTWILPGDYDQAEAESRHLIYESDSDKDAKLTKQEIVEKYDLFVGSQATEFGDALTKHDEF